MENPQSTPIRVAIVGPCASGKSTLAPTLREAGYQVHHVAQEHSYLPAMWQRFTQPDALIYLDVTYDAIMARRPKFDFKPKDLKEQHRRLAHARQHCDLYVDTSVLGTADVQQKVLTFLSKIDQE